MPQVAPQMSDFKVNGKSLKTDGFDINLKVEAAPRAKPMVSIPAAAVSGTHVHIKHMEHRHNNKSPRTPVSLMMNDQPGS